jgi:hypothetical protein
MTVLSLPALAEAAVSSGAAHQQQPSSLPPLHDAGSSAGHQHQRHRPRTAQGTFAAAYLSHSLLRPARASEMKAAMEAEGQAKREFAASQRMLNKTAREFSQQLLLFERRRNAEAVRAEQDVETGKDLKTLLGGVAPADDEQVTELARLLNVAMARMFPDMNGQSAYFKLFRWMDRDSSGLISLYEFSKMVRRRGSRGPTPRRGTRRLARSCHMPRTQQSARSRRRAHGHCTPQCHTARAVRASHATASL